MKIQVKMNVNNSLAVGDIVVDNNIEWVIIGITHAGFSRVKRNSLAHKVHAESSPEIAKSLIKSQ